MIHIAKSDRDFTIVQNSIFLDNRVSPEAKGLYAQIMSLKSDSWRYSLSGLASLFNCKIYKIRTAKQELERLGYLIVNAKTDKTGKFNGAEYTLFHYPYNEPKFIEFAKKKDYEGFEAYVKASDSGFFPSLDKTALRENPSTDKLGGHNKELTSNKELKELSNGATQQNEPSTTKQPTSTQEQDGLVVEDALGLEPTPQPDKRKAKKAGFVPPTLEDLAEYMKIPKKSNGKNLVEVLKDKGYTTKESRREVVDAFIDHYDRADWRRSDNGNKITNWKTAFGRWIDNQNEKSEAPRNTYQAEQTFKPKIITA